MEDNNTTFEVIDNETEVVNNEVSFEFSSNLQPVTYQNQVDAKTLAEFQKLPEKYAKEGFGVPHFEGETFELQAFKVQDEDKKADIPAFGVFTCKDGNSISLTALCRRGNGITWKFDEPKTGVNIAKYICLLLANNVKVTLKISKIILGVGKRNNGSTFESKTYIFEPVEI